MERQTNLPLEDLVAILRGEKHSHYPRCFIFNELGALCYQGEDAKDEGLEIFSESLKSDDPAEKFISLCFLLIIPSAEVKFKQELENFMAEEANRDIIAQAREKVENFKI